MTITVESGGARPPITTLTGVAEQAALQGLLRRLYSLCPPLVSVNRIEPDLEELLGQLVRGGRRCLTDR